jgi:hypothetical protein
VHYPLSRITVAPELTYPNSLTAQLKELIALI